VRFGWGEYVLCVKVGSSVSFSWVFMCLEEHELRKKMNGRLDLPHDQSKFATCTDLTVLIEN
jgi:hypothetical protein